jgi:hypothetical protein
MNEQRRLKDYERPIWRKTFEACLPHMSVEAAERKAWFAVDRWHANDAFNKPSSEDDNQSNSGTNYRALWETIGKWIDSLGTNSALSAKEVDRVWEAIADVNEGRSDEDEFAASLREIFDASEEDRTRQTPTPQLTEYEEAWKSLAMAFSMAKSAAIIGDSFRLTRTMNEFALGKLSLVELKTTFADPELIETMFDGLPIIDWGAAWNVLIEFFNEASVEMSKEDAKKFATILRDYAVGKLQLTAFKQDVRAF